MKPAHFVLPVVALVLGLAWLGLQQRELHEVERAGAMLAAALERVDGADGSLAVAMASKSKGTESRAKPNWKAMGTVMLSTDREGRMDYRSVRQFQKQLAAMNARELLDSITELRALKLPRWVTAELEGMVVQTMVKKDPQFALEHCAGHLSENSTANSALDGAVRAWAVKDATAAAAWMDRMIAEGHFDNNRLNSATPRHYFEALMIGGLLSTDPAAAARRVEAYPEDQRGFILGGVFVREGSEKATADLLRASLPKDQAVKLLGSTASLLAYQGGLDRVGQFLATAGATPEERASAVMRTLERRPLNASGSPATIDEKRTWIQAQAPPADIERLSGAALGLATDGKNYTAMCALAARYQADSGSDDAVVAFLTSTPSYDQTEALKLADSIRDETQREKRRAHILK